MVPNKDPFENLFFNFSWQTSFYEESYIGFKKTLSEKKDLEVKTTYRKILFLEKIRHLLKLITLSLPAFLITFSNTEIVQADEL